MNQLSFNVNQECLNKEYQEVKGKRNLFKNQVFLLMEINKWVVLISR